ESFCHTVELGMMSSFIMTKEGTEVKGTVSEGQAKGYAFITEKQIKKGKIVLVGSMPMGDEGTDLWKRIIKHYTSHSELESDLIMEPGIVIIPRKNIDNNKNQYWLVNLTNEMKTSETINSVRVILEGDQMSARRYTILPFAYKGVEEIY